ncbi:hypothetical protein GE09DRAFT_1165042 [Coniochaeta sp. 2T2.1]|nr:hypothetical protein GE09DRAFT_1165042 [Coniochaeta sp. 2T2.1]
MAPRLHDTSTIAFLFCSLFSASFALDPRFPEFNRLKPLLDTARPQITAGPSAQAVDLLFAKRQAVPTIPFCAWACLESARTSSTPCQHAELACECNPTNAAKVSTAAVICVVEACGVQTAQLVSSAAVQICQLYSATAQAAPTQQNTVVIVTTTGDNGSGKTITSFVGTATGSSSSSSSSGAGSSASSDSSDNLSKGAIAGIAVGATLGGVLLCAALFFIYRCTSRKKDDSVAAVPATATHTDAQLSTMKSPPPVAGATAGPAPGKPELDCCAGVYPMSTSTRPSPQYSSGAPAPVSAQGNTGPPVHPGMVEAPHRSWQLHPGQVPVQGQAGHELPGVVYSEVHEAQGARPEMGGEPVRAAQELRGQAYQGAVYEMPSSNSR